MNGRRDAYMINDAGVVTVDALGRVLRWLHNRVGIQHTCVSQYFLVSISIPEEIVLQNPRTI